MINETKVKALIAAKLNGKVLMKTDDGGIAYGIVCGRCWGSGRHGPLTVYSGICFNCDGKKYTGIKRIKDVDRWLKNAIKRNVKAAIEAKEAREKWEAGRAERNRDAWIEAMLKIRLAAGKEEARLRAAATSEYVGKIGERLKGLKLEVVFIKTIETRFGTSNLIIFKDPEGNKFKTFYGGSDGTLTGYFPAGDYWDPDKDERITRGFCLKITGTVKKHETYRDEKSTVLTRIKAEAL